ncbi:fractalkine isoform X2 [Anolis carolinensis]|uniref:fractalkine isoform X2 n=1 Tax=Anolis carolinensis TaxID=28377 RepID=UPI002F2B294D
MRGRAALLVVALTWLWPIHAVAGEPEAGKHCQRECPANPPVTREFPEHLLESYEKVPCRGKTSVIFTTKRNKSFCADPEKEWVQSRMKTLDAKRALPPQQSGSLDKLSQDIKSTPDVGHAHTIQTSTGWPLRTTSGTLVGPSPEPAAQNRDIPTLEPDADGTVASPTTTLRLGEDLTNNGEDPKHDSGALGAISSRPNLLNPMRSSMSPTFHLVGKASVPPTPSTTFPTSPRLSASVLSPINGLQDSVELQGEDVTDSSIDGGEIRDIKDATRDSSAAFVGTLRTSLSTEAIKDVSPEPPRPRQRSQVEATTSRPEGTSTLMSEYRTHILSLTAVGVLLVVSILAGWVWLKRHIPTTASPKEQVLGLLYDSSRSQEDAYAMQTL